MRITVITNKRSVTYISNFNYDEYDEYSHELYDEFYSGKKYCDICGSKLIKGKEKYEAYGSELYIDIWYCPQGCC